MNIVSIMAHQDDEMRCLGTMLKCRDRGDRVWFITLTDGCKGFVDNPGISRAEAASIRHAEMSALAESAGGHLLSLGEHDEFLYDTPQVRMALIEAIRKSGADCIFSHYEKDYNADHVTTAFLVRHCAMQAALPVLPTDSPCLKSHPAIFMVEPTGWFDFPASHAVDISAHHGQKVSLLNNHASQVQALPGEKTLEQTCRISDAYWGDRTGCRYAEPFMPMPGRGTVKPFSVLP